ncbi:MAG: GNAT family N-acetyltransferase [Spirochaetia bacterium]
MFELEKSAELEIRAGEVDLAIEVMQEVAQWCIESGNPMWSLGELTRGKLLRHPRAEDSFIVARSGGTPAASMILQWHDLLFWPMVKEYESGFIHKLCVRREFAGKGLSTALVGHAVRECSRQGVEYLRLDTDITKPKLHDLYERMGFVRAGRKLVDGRDYALYELRL